MKLRIDVNQDGFKRLRTMAEALTITAGDLRGPVLVRVGQKHREQMKNVFASQGATSGRGRWAALSASYRARKRRLLGSAGKILVLSGDMRDRFITPSRAEYVQSFHAAGNLGIFLLGALSSIAGYHFRGSRRLPRRDMVTKTAGQIAAIRKVLVDWYRKERVPQVLRHFRRGV